MNGQMVQIDQVNQLEARIFTTYGHNQVQSSRLPACNRLMRIRHAPFASSQACHQKLRKAAFDSMDAQAEAAGTGKVHWRRPGIARAPKGKTEACSSRRII